MKTNGIPMLRRKIYDRLMEWKSHRGRNCLLVKGQRQVGKTYIIRRFAEDNYEHVVYMDLGQQKDLHQAFERGLDVDTVVKGLKLFLDPKGFIPYKTLIFMDGIQACPRARESLESFSADDRYDVICSESALDTIYREGSEARVPAGYEESVTM